MTDEELQAIVEHANLAHRYTPSGDVLALVAEVRRLKGLIKQAEWEGACCGCNLCPWCGQRKGESPHGEQCPAFTPGGATR